MTEVQLVPLETSDREQFISMSTAADSVTDKNGRLGFCMKCLKNRNLDGFCRSFLYSR